VYGAYRVFGLGEKHELQSLLVNAAWGLNNILVMLPMIRAAQWQPPDEVESAEPPANTTGDASLAEA